MYKTEYETLIEKLGEDYDLDLSSKLLDKLASKACGLESESLEQEDIFLEMLEIIPEDFREEDNWNDFIGEIADEIYDNAVEPDEDDEDESEGLFD